MLFLLVYVGVVYGVLDEWGIPKYIKKGFEGFEKFGVWMLIGVAWLTAAVICIVMSPFIIIGWLFSQSTNSETKPRKKKAKRDVTDAL